MTLDPSRARVPTIARKLSRLVGDLRKSFGGARSQAGGIRGLLTPEEFQEELIVLGLSGKKFVMEDYAAALADFLRISVTVHVIPDTEYPELTRCLALSGRLGEIRCSDELGLAAVFVPESLPTLVSDLTVFHELGHLAAGDLSIAPAAEGAALPDERLFATGFPTAQVSHGKRLARGLPFAAESNREHEANLRASYAFIAGCLGDENPYVHRMYQVL